MRRLLVTAGCLAGIGTAAAAIGCATGGGTTSTGTAGRPAPSPYDPSSSGAATVTAGGRGTAVTYRPVNNAGYIFHRLDSLTLHLPGGAVQQQSLERRAYLRVTLVEAGGSYRATIVLDSLQAAASAVAVPADSLKPAQGTRWTATVSPDGRLSNLMADRSTTLGDQLTNQLRLLFPTLPSGGAHADASWADSLEFPLKADAFDAIEHARTSYRASDDGSGNGLKIESTGTYTRAGKGKQFNQQMEMTASGKRQNVHRLGRNGMLTAADGSESGDMTITVPAIGQTVPVTQSSRYDIRATGR